MITKAEGEAAKIALLRVCPKAVLTHRGIDGEEVPVIAVEGDLKLYYAKSIRGTRNEAEAWVRALKGHLWRQRLGDSIRKGHARKALRDGRDLHGKTRHISVAFTSTDKKMLNELEAKFPDLTISVLIKNLVADSHAVHCAPEA